MQNKNYIDAFKSLLGELQQITIEAMAEAGVKKSSDLSKSVKYVITKDGIKMEVLNYYPWVSEGHKVVRRAMVSKVPIDALIRWIKKRGLTPSGGKTINQLAFAIQQAIYKRGLSGRTKTKGKKYADPVANDIADYTSKKLADVLAVQIADELVEMFAPIAVN